MVLVLTFYANTKDLQQFMINKHILCDHCRGTGAASDRDIQTCPTCGGSGVQITRQQMFPGMVVQGQTT